MAMAGLATAHGSSEVLPARPSRARPSLARPSLARPSPGAETALRFLALGDALLENPACQRWEGGAQIDSFRLDSVLAWLRNVLPDIAIDDADIVSSPQDTTVAAEARLAAHHDQVSHYDGALVLLGLQDCFRMMDGTAPAPPQSIAALQAIIDGFIARSIRPFVVLPPPCRQFVNGLFADRYLSICASLRRMARQRPGMTLIDGTDTLLGRTAKGIEPAPGVSSGDDCGRLAPRGAHALAALIAQVIRDAFALPASLRDGTTSRARTALNQNPLLKGHSGGHVGGGSQGAVPDGFTLDTAHGGGIHACVLSNEPAGPDSGLRLSTGGHYTSAWPFLRLHHDLPADRLLGLDPGEEIEAFAEFEAPADPSNLAFAALQMTPVWTSGYAGLFSGEFAGAAVLSPGTRLLAHTPRFRIPERLTQLGLTVLIYFLPGSDLDAEATLVLRSIVLRRALSSHV